ncbi:MAG: cysteine--tRNA ligase [Minisyncoccota bacterium]
MFSIHNTLTNKVEPFKPLNNGEVKMYHCGPTVYDHVHIGNLRSFILADILRRSFEYTGNKVTQVMNVTDIGHLSGDSDDGEDKMTKALKREGKPLNLESMRKLADFYTERFKEDIAKMNILIPHVMPKASDHIKEDVELINELEDKGFTYKTSDGLYFDTSKDPNYGKLGGTGEGESRIRINSEKKNSKDFALWKFNSEIGYPSPWGQGFPGWHIECSAMSQKYLGKTFDIHTGGIDLAPIHHNNEIAQSENACGCEFAHYWLHNEFVNVDSGKMAKSVGNIIKLKDVEEKSFSPLAYRYFLLLSHYRTPSSFSWEALEAAQNAYRKLKEFISTLPFEGEVDKKYKKDFVNAIESDLATAEALATTWKLVKDESIDPRNKRATLLDFDKVLGLNLENNEFAVGQIPEEVQKIINEREEARARKDFKKSDELRDEINKKGFVIEDSADGLKVSKK